jgi:hypothetical protein
MEPAVIATSSRAGSGSLRLQFGVSTGLYFCFGCRGGFFFWLFWVDLVSLGLLAVLSSALLQQVSMVSLESSSCSFGRGRTWYSYQLAGLRFAKPAG